jgi:two-component system, NarL family, invasion response regulator UvrY
MSVINIVVADDHPIVRTGIRQLLLNQPDMRIIGEAASGEELLEVIPRLETDVLVLDISMPGPPFLELLGRLRRVAPGTRILVMSMHPEQEYAIRALRAGASGYITKDRSTDELPTAIRKVYQAGRYVTPTLAEHLAAALSETDSAPHEALSAREFEVFQMLVAGKTVKQIAAALQVSAKTVSTYRTRLLHKVNAQTTADLVRYALKHQLLDASQN